MHINCPMPIKHNEVNSLTLAWARGGLFFNGYRVIGFGQEGT